MINLVKSMRKFQEEFGFPVGSLFFVGVCCLGTLSRGEKLDRDYGKDSQLLL